MGKIESSLKCMLWIFWQSKTAAFKWVCPNKAAVLFSLTISFYQNMLVIKHYGVHYSLTNACYSIKTDR